MVRIVFGVFLVMHGLVHLLYYGQSARRFELQPGLLWPDGSWAFSKLLGEGATRSLAGILLILVAVGFIAGGIGLFIQQAWWRPVVIGTATFSSALFILLWDGGTRALDQKGGVGLLINLAILALLMFIHWPPI